MFFAQVAYKSMNKKYTSGPPKVRFARLAGKKTGKRGGGKLSVADLKQVSRSPACTNFVHITSIIIRLGIIIYGYACICLYAAEPCLSTR